MYLVIPVDNKEKWSEIQDSSPEKAVEDYLTPLLSSKRSF